MATRKLLLIVLDGFGVGPLNEHNAIWKARTPFFDSLVKQYPHTLLEAAGEAVGTLPGQIGTSEVGHLNIGAGRVVNQDIARIHQDIDQGGFFKNLTLLQAIQHTSRYNSTLHLIGLVSPGGVHSHTKHLLALLKLAQTQGVPRVSIHAFTDGRDTPPSSAQTYLKELENTLHTYPSTYRLATLMGRFYGMDRNQNWERTKLAFAALTQGNGHYFANSQNAVAHFYTRGITDEFIEPCVLVDKHSLHLIRDNDALIFFNFRADRMRQLSNLFLNHAPDISRHSTKNLYCVSFTSYVDNPRNIAVTYPALKIQNHLSEALSQLNIAQFKISETEKYAHLTYFFNGGREAPYPKEERLMIPSPTVADFSATPQMASPEIAKTVTPILEHDKFPFVAINFCNADMLGHTGNIQTAIAGIECLDQCLKKVVPTAKQNNYSVIITADHGNAEEMYIPEIGSMHTAHTLNKVPFILMSHRIYTLKQEGKLANVAPTILQLMGLEKPPEMTAPSLLQA